MRTYSVDGPVPGRISLHHDFLPPHSLPFAIDDQFRVFPSAQEGRTDLFLPLCCFFYLTAVGRRTPIRSPVLRGRSGRYRHVFLPIFSRVVGVPHALGDEGQAVRIRIRPDLGVLGDRAQRDPSRGVSKRQGEEEFVVWQRSGRE